MVALCLGLLLPVGVAAQGGLPQGSPMRTQSRQDAKPRILKDVGIEQRLDEQIPLDLVFKDENGRQVRLGQYFGERRPVVLALVYYTCPMLCNQVLDGLASSTGVLSFDAGKEFEVVAVSFDPRDTPETASAKKADYLARYKRNGAAAGCHFLTGDEASIASLTGAVGFKYAFDPQTNQFAHGSGIMVVTPEGKLARYFYGIEYAPRDLRLGLVEASENKIGTPVDMIVLYCYHYDPSTGKYGAVVMNMMRLGGGLTIIGVVVLLFILRRRNPARSGVGVGGVA
jgi:protein SCO1/2